MDENERAIILGQLRTTSDTFLTQVHGISESQAAWKPAADRWSIRECAEHVAVAELGMLRLITKKTTPIVEAAVVPGREDAYFKGGMNRIKTIIAPGSVRPSDRFQTLSEALNNFRENRSRTVAYIERCQEELRAYETVHPLVGRVTARECLALLIIHPARHALQIRELREHQQFPR